MKAFFLMLLFGGALWLSTGIVRNLTIPGIGSLEKQIQQDWQSLSESNPEFSRLAKIELVPSETGGITNVWSREICLACFEKQGADLAAEVLVLSTDTDDGPAATVQIYIYELKSGEFVKEISRLYHL